MRFTLPLALLALAATSISPSAENPPKHPKHWTFLMPTVTAALPLGGLRRQHGCCMIS
jgi:hypothetical protein